jgi:diketogulonate reductase-like aldo/keto reductase
MRNVIFEALDNGYRHFDTAHAYRTEGALGLALEEACLEIFFAHESCLPLYTHISPIFL